MKRMWHYPLDRTAWTLMVGLAIVIAVLIALGDHTVPQVKDFSWRDRFIGAEDRAFTMTFNRPMTWEQVKSNLNIDPTLKGKVSWSGRRFAYTLNEPIPYGQSFSLSLDQVRERPRGTLTPKVMKPFQASFQSRDRAFVYLGTNAEESGRLVLNNLSQDQKTLLTPENLEILDFQPFPTGDRILFSASQRDPNNPGQLDPYLYVVSTGLGLGPADRQDSPIEPMQTVRKILGDDRYQLLKFSLSPDGQRVVFQRALRSENGALGQVSMWQMPIDGDPEELQTESGGDFQIAPDGQTLVMAQGQGLAVLPLENVQSTEPLDYLPEFGNLLSFSLDGSAAAMVKFNNDFTRSLFFVSNQGEQRELIRLQGGILSAQFDPQKENLYGLFTRVKETEEYEEQPYLARIELKTKKVYPLLNLPMNPNISMSLAPDAQSLLFDQVFESPVASSEDLAQADTGLVAASNLWQLPLTKASTPAQPKQLGSGATPKWLP